MKKPAAVASSFGLALLAFFLAPTLIVGFFRYIGWLCDVTPGGHAEEVVLTLGGVFGFLGGVFAAIPTGICSYECFTGKGWYA